MFVDSLDSPGESRLGIFCDLSVSEKEVGPKG